MRARRFRWWFAAVAIGLWSCAAPPGDGTVTLNFWAFGREGAVVAGLMRDFERLHPGVRVNVQQVPWRAAHEKLLTGYVGETLPDVAQLGNTWVPEFAALGALAPLDTLVAHSPTLRRDDFFAGIWATNVIAYDRGSRDNLVNTLENRLTSTAVTSSQQIANIPDVLKTQNWAISSQLISLLITLAVMVLIGAVAWFAWERWRMWPELIVGAPL